MATTKYDLKESDGWVQIADGTGTFIVQVVKGNVYMALADSVPEAFTDDHHTLPDWITITAEAGNAYIRSQTGTAEVVVSEIPATT